MHYALFIYKDHYGIIPTDHGPGLAEKSIHGQWVTVLVAPQDYVDNYLGLNKHHSNYLKKRMHAFTDTQKRNAILSFYGHTHTHTFDASRLLDSTDDSLAD